MLYAIVSFDDTNEAEFLPVKWIADSTPVSDLPQLAKMRSKIKFYWPPWRSPLAVSKAQRKCQDAHCDWPICSGRLLSTACK